MAGAAGKFAGLSVGAKRGLVAGGVAVAAALLGAAVAFGGGSDQPSATPSTSTTSSTAVVEPVTTTTQAPVGPVAPLTGLRLPEGTVLDRPALAVKVDNLDAARETALPQSGLPRADVIYEEVVEGNITRLVAVFHSQDPGRVGPVRSARTTDVHLLPQLGRVLLAWSGGNQGVVGAVRGSASIIDVGYDTATGSYERDGSRRAPHNLYVRAGELWGGAGDAGAPPALFRYRAEGQPDPPTAQPALGVSITWGGGIASSPVAWTWDPALRVYVRDQNGRPHADADGTRLAAPNVVVLVTEYGRSAADSRSPEAVTVGSGEAFVYTNGTVVHGRWDRPSEDRPAALTDDAGQPILLTPGQTWVELPRSGGVTTTFP